MHETPRVRPAVVREERTLFFSERNAGIDMIIVHSISEYIWWPEEYSGVASRHVPVLEWLTEPVAGRHNGVSAHRFIDPEGVIHDICEDGLKAWHAGTSRFHGEDDLNRIALGVEMVVRGRHDYPSFLQAIETDCYTDVQYRSLGWLVHEWMVDHPHITEDRVVGHSDVSGDDVRGPGRGKRDPGPGFNWQRMWYEAERWSA